LSSTFVTIIPMQLSLILSVVSLITSTILLVLVVRLLNHYNSLTKDSKTGDLVVSLNHLIKTVKENRQEVETVNKKLASFIETSKLHFKKMGFIRFNPFSHTGGDQSFAVCLLDENNDGIVISSLHSRENTRVYAKKLTNGISSDQILSKEEKSVINQALKS
jgi:hypothetical protein